MLKKIFVSFSVLLIAGVFCSVYPQDKEAVIKLDSPEDIARFQEIFENKTGRAESDLDKALADSVKQTPKTTGAADTEFKTAKPAAAEAAKSKVKTALPASDKEFKVYKPQPKEESAAEAVIPKSNDSDEKFQVFIPKAKEETEEINKSVDGNIKWLDSDEEIEEFNELLKKAHQGL